MVSEWSVLTQLLCFKSVFQFRCLWAATDISKPKASKFVGKGTDQLAPFLSSVFHILLIIKYIYVSINMCVRMCANMCVYLAIFQRGSSSNFLLTSPPQTDICSSFQWRNFFFPFVTKSIPLVWNKTKQKPESSFVKHRAFKKGMLWY